MKVRVRKYEILEQQPHSRMKVRRRHKFVVAFLVEVESNDSEKSEPNVVSRRFKVFKRLHRSIRRQFPRSPVPKLPSFSFGRFDDGYILVKCKQLNEYLQQLLLVPELQDSETFRGFLDEMSCSDDDEYDRPRPQTKESELLYTLPCETIRLKKGQAFELVFNITSPGCVIAWEFSTLRNDIGFEVTIDGESAIPYRRSKCHVRVARGSLKAASAGVCKLTWDNSYSWRRGKTLTYRAAVLPLDSSVSSGPEGGSELETGRASVVEVAGEGEREGDLELAAAEAELLAHEQTHAAHGVQVQAQAADSSGMFRPGRRNAQRQGSRLLSAAAAPLRVLPHIRAHVPNISKLHSIRRRRGRGGGAQDDLSGPATGLSSEYIRSGYVMILVQRRSRLPSGVLPQLSGGLPLVQRKPVSTNTSGKWMLRWAVLDTQRGRLQLFKHRGARGESASAQRRRHRLVVMRRGRLNLRKVNTMLTVGPGAPGAPTPFILDVRAGRRRWKLCADTEDAFHFWREAISQSIHFVRWDPARAGHGAGADVADSRSLSRSQGQFSGSDYGEGKSDEDEEDEDDDEEEEEEEDDEDDDDREDDEDEDEDEEDDEDDEDEEEELEEEEDESSCSDVDAGAGSSQPPRLTGASSASFIQHERAGLQLGQHVESLVASNRAKVLIFVCLNISLVLVQSGSWHTAALACLVLNGCNVGWRAILATVDGYILEGRQDIYDHSGADALDSSSDSD